MARQVIATGSSPNDGTGDNLRAGGTKINDNFTELYDLFGNGTTLSSGSWDVVNSGINTLSDVGIGTTNPRFTLEVGAVGASGTSLHVNGDARITGIISTTQVIISGETLTGAGVTSLVAGSNITLSGSTGQVTINASGGGGGSAGVGGTWSNYDGVTGVTTTKKVKIQNDLEVTGVTTSTGGFVGTLDGVVGGNSPAAITGTTITANTNFSGNLTGNVTGNASGSSGSCSGNSATATVLAASRNIGGVAFNGSGDINLPGVNQAGNQDTSGTAAIATNVTVTDESTDTICFPLFTTAATGNLPPKSGTNLTFNSSTGTLSANNFDGNATGLTGTPNLVVGIITATSLEGNASDMTAGQWVLGANGTSDYTFTGPGLSGAQNDPSLYLQRGKTYKFVNGMGAHPFQIQLTSGQGGTAYNNGVTNNGTSSGTVTIEVRQDAPDILYYQCTSHANMGGILNIVGSGVPTGGIIMWSGASVPGGWSLCDGTNSTPDLRDRFIVSSGSVYSIGDTGGVNSVTLTVDQIPAHTHAITAINDGSPSVPYSSPRSASASEIDSGSTGGGQSHENRPPYYALAFIMKT
jgi:hypothetical protein